MLAGVHQGPAEIEYLHGLSKVRRSYMQLQSKAKGNLLDYELRVKTNELGQ